MHPNRLPIFALLALALGLTACGGSDQQGVTLQGVNSRATATPLPTAAPTATASAPDTLSGTLLLLKGHRYALFDLGSGTLTAFEQSTPSFSPALLSTDQTRGAFVAFPDYGVIDLTTRTVSTIANRAGDPQGLTISPDGRWIVGLTGSFSPRLTLLATDGSSTHNVAAGSGAVFVWTWTADGRFVWWRQDDPASVPQVFDPDTDQSAPLDDASTPLIPPLPARLSPDGTRAVQVPIVIAVPGQPAPTTCYDSYVGLRQGPFTLAALDTASETIYTEPGLIASSPAWLDDTHLLFVKVGTGTCGTLQGEAVRQVLLLDTDAPDSRPQVVAGPLGNADDSNDRTQLYGGQYGHLYAPSPDGRYLAWIGGSVAEGESVLNVTTLATGETQPVLRFTRAATGDLATFIEDVLLRQVVWLE